MATPFGGLATPPGTWMIYLVLDSQTGTNTYLQRHTTKEKAPLLLFLALSSQLLQVK